MSILFYTVAHGSEFRRLASRVRRPVNVSLLDMPVDRTDPEYGLHVYAMRSRVREVFDIEQYEAVVQVEADVGFSPAFLAQFSGDEIKVERGDRTLSELGFYPGRDQPHPVDQVAPWNGCIYVPRARYGFFDRWTENYPRFFFHRNEEFTLWETLRDFPWRFFDSTAFWPDQADLVHYRGFEAKRSLTPKAEWVGLARACLTNPAAQSSHLGLFASTA